MSYPIFQAPSSTSLFSSSGGLKALSNQRHVDHQTERDTLLASLRGQTIRIPDLGPLFTHWPTKKNSEVDRMRTDITEWLDATLSPGKSLGVLQSSDLGLFGATFWPNTTFPKLQIVTYLAAWLFAWDDEIDRKYGSMWNEFSAAQLYRQQTLAYVRYTLGMDTIPSPPVTNIVILSFEPVGAALKATYTLEKNKMVYRELQYMVEMSEREQRQRLSGATSSIDDFWQFRLGASAVALVLAFNEFSCENMDLPASFYEDDDVKCIINCTNTIICATNDLMSMEKEIQHDSTDSLIPILFSQGRDVQVAVQQVVMFIKNEINTLDEAAGRLEKKYDDLDLKRQVREYIDGSDIIIVGGGTSGVVLASRLYQRKPELSITLIEAGPDVAGHAYISDPAEAALLHFSDLDYKYMTVPQKHLNGAPRYNCAIKGLSGGTIINNGGWIRGDKLDYYEWAREVNDDRWSYDGLLLYFKQSEKHFDPNGDPEQHGFDGPIVTASVDSSGRKFPLRHTVLKMWSSGLGLQLIAHGNNGHPQGIIDLVENWKDGKREGHWIGSADPETPPVIDPNYFATEVDNHVMRESFRMQSRVMLDTNEGRDLVLGEYTPPGQAVGGLNATNEQIDERIKLGGSTTFHPGGTASMGKVVGTSLKVYGVKGLRVVDACVIPNPIASHLQAAVYAIAEQAVDIILEDFSVASSE
ncbi:FAD/NAD(P)-binding domain-containing protein [Massarina eburnea CBS 473.64]|uniref:FAD/NAD(P)-binding domain-containing protein n=1 Tax=Massarina eburnea CBS 473.64 TaxID=1395130 RepID=A0A6A6S8G9_9PLEO|nr:FAD/NAD(P)-binding domain-containing protein [Massarina eburnea CBS 473.64]